MRLWYHPPDETSPWCCHRSVESLLTVRLALTQDSGPLGRLADEFFEARFRAALVRELGKDVPESAGFSGIIALVRALVIDSSGSAAEVSAASQRVLTSLFPDFPPRPPDTSRLLGTSAAGRVGLLYWFEVLFARPFPAFAAKLNAWVTWWAAQWLMGSCVLEDLTPEELAVAGDARYDGAGQVLRVRRCRFLEESACASVCVNACKMPTQAFFNDDMGVPMRMVPDYETLECRFQFGVPPTPEDEAEARNTPCFGACPMAPPLRSQSRMVPPTDACVGLGGMSRDERDGDGYGEQAKPEDR